MRPTLHTDAYEDGSTPHVPIIFLAGPIKHWWTQWGSGAHLDYVRHRTLLRSLLIEHGYLTYAAWDAIKGTWDERAQAINNSAILASDLIINLTPWEIPAVGTVKEIEFARTFDIPVLFAPPDIAINVFMDTVRGTVGEGVRYS